MASTRVVLPWSTWAMIATLRMSVRWAMSGHSGYDPRVRQPGESVQQVQHALRRAWEHGAGAAFDYRALQQLRVRSHQGDQVVIREVALAEGERRVGRLLDAQCLRRAQPRLRQQRADLLLGQRLDVVVDALEVDPSTLEQLEQPPARRARRLLVDGQAGFHDAAST